MKKPTALLELSGAFKKNPSRRRDGEPPSSGPIGDPPDRLPDEARPFWHEIVAMSPAGVLQKSDRWTLEIISRLMLKLVAVLEVARLAELGPRDVRQLLQREQISSAELLVLRSLLGSCGLSPADRSKLSVSPEKPRNKFAALAEEGSIINNRPN